METTVTSTCKSKISKLQLNEGVMVQADDLVIVFEEMAI